MTPELSVCTAVSLSSRPVCVAVCVFGVYFCRSCQNTASHHTYRHSISCGNLSMHGLFFKLQVQKVKVVSLHIVFQWRYKEQHAQEERIFHMENWLIILYFSGDGKKCLTF